MEQKIIAIVRASTERQETESQRRELCDWIVGSLRYPAEAIRIIEVAGASAVKLNDAYLQMWEDVKAAVLDDGIKAVALWDINRLGRNGRMLNEMKYFFIDHGVQVYFKNQGIELLDSRGQATIGGNIVFDVFANVVEDETKEMFAKMRRGKERNKQLKKYNGGGGPHGALFGYRIGNDKTIVIDQDEAAQVRMIYNEYATGKYSFAKLTDELRDRGVEFRGRKPTLMVVTHTLSNDAYKGYCSEWQRPYDPIIDPELWDKVAQIRDGKRLKIATKEVKHTRLALNVLSRCPLCGRKYVANDRQYMCYAQHSYKAIHAEKCDAVSVRIDVLDGILWGVAQIYHHKRLLSANSSEIEELKGKIEITRSKLATKRNDVELVNAKIEELGDDYYGGVSMTKTQYTNRLAKLQDRLQSLNGEIANLAREAEEYEAEVVTLEKPESERNAEILLSVNEERDRKRIREIINATIDHVDITGDTKQTGIVVTMKDGEVFDFVYNTRQNIGKRSLHPQDNVTLTHGGRTIDCGIFGKGRANILSLDCRDYLSDLIGIPRQSLEALLRKLMETSKGGYSLRNEDGKTQIIFR